MNFDCDLGETLKKKRNFDELTPFSSLALCRRTEAIDAVRLEISQTIPQPGIWKQEEFFALFSLQRAFKVKNSKKKSYRKKLSLRKKKNSVKNFFAPSLS